MHPSPGNEESSAQHDRARSIVESITVLLLPEFPQISLRMKRWSSRSTTFSDSFVHHLLGPYNSLTQARVRNPLSQNPGQESESEFSHLQALSSMFVYTHVSCVSAVAGVDSISWEVPLEWKRSSDPDDLQSRDLVVVVVLRDDRDAVCGRRRRYP